MSFIEIKNLTYAYENDDHTKDETLKGLTFSIEKGEFVALLGHNGSGKSTLAKLLSSVLDMQGGEIIIDGQSLSEVDTEEKLFALRRKVGMVFQNPDDQLVATVVEEDIAFGPENLGLPPTEIRRRVYQALKAVDMLAYHKHAPHRLSGGQKQRVAIAGVLAMMPECIVFDEATAMLDPKGRRDVMDMIEKIHKSGITVLHITHNMKEALAADRVIVVNDGMLYLEGSPKEVFKQVEALEAIGLEAPQVTELAYQLAKRGIVIDRDITTEDEAFDAIMTLYEESL